MQLGCLSALFLWLPVIIFKIISRLWKLNLFIIQKICGVPLYYCTPGFRALGIFFGTIGLLALMELLLLLLIMGSTIGQKSVYTNFPKEYLIIIGLGGLGFLLLGRFVIRRGAL